MRREADTLARHGNNVCVMSLTENDVPRIYKLRDVTVIELKIKKYPNNNILRYFMSYNKFFLYALLACTKLFMKGQIDIVHVHNMPNFIVFTAIIPRIFGKGLILDIHDSMPETYVSKFGTLNHILFKILRLEELFCCTVAHKVICVTHTQRDILVKRGIPSAKITVLLNSPDNTIFSSTEGKIRNHDSTNGKEFKIVYHGTIDKMAGVDLVIKAISRLLDEIPNPNFYVIGRNGNIDELEKLSRRLDLKEHVYFSNGVYPVEVIPKLLYAMDLGIVSNRKSIATDLALPVKLIEYVIMGIPVVAPRLKTIEYYFSDNMVGYFEPDNVDSMAGAILKLYKDKKRRLNQSLKAMSFLDNYNWEKHQELLINLYNSF